MNSMTKTHRLQSTLVVLSLGLASFFMVSCETEDDNKLAKAQQCLDGLTDSSSTSDAQVCADKVSGLTSSESYVIRCSVNFFKGGITSAKIIQAFDDYNNAGTNNKAAVMMAALKQTTTADAQATADACKSSGVPSLIYIASLSLTGTSMAEAAGSTDPAVFLPYCANASNDCDDTVVGQAVVTMYDSYCKGDAAKTQTCVEAGSAIAAGGGDYQAIAEQLYALLQ